MTPNETHSPGRGAGASGGGRTDRVGSTWTALKFSSVGLEMAVAIAIGWGIGYWLDLQLESAPIFMFVFLGVGIAAGFKGVFRAAREAEALMGDRPARGAETPERPAESSGRAPAGKSPAGETSEDPAP